MNGDIGGIAGNGILGNIGYGIELYEEWMGDGPESELEESEESSSELSPSSRLVFLSSDEDEDELVEEAAVVLMTRSTLIKRVINRNDLVSIFEREVISTKSSYVLILFSLQE